MRVALPCVLAQLQARSGSFGAERYAPTSTVAGFVGRGKDRLGPAYTGRRTNRGSEVVARPISPSRSLITLLSGRRA